MRFYSTIEVMYLSFRRSEHALLALAFFVVMVLIVFSTLLCVLPLIDFSVIENISLSAVTLPSEAVGTRPWGPS